MRINWKLRFKNKLTLSAMISAGALLANQICGLLGVDYSEQIKQVVDILSTLLLILTLVGVVIDPTVKGGSDSDMSMNKDEPTEPDMDLTIKGEKEVKDTSEVLIDNTKTNITNEADKHKPRVEDL